MPKIPRLKAIQIIKALHRLGFQTNRVCGSHVRLIHPDGRKVTVPRHNRPIFIGTLHSIIQQAQISVKELLQKIR